MVYLKKAFGLRPVLWSGCAVLALATFAPLSGAAQECAVVDGTLEADCTHSNAGTVVATPTQPNTELAKNPPVPATGFVIRVDGEVLQGDKRLEDTKRRSDLALADADIQVKFDGLDVRPRLDVDIVGNGTQFRRGDRVTFQSRLNYPGWVTRGEIRVLDLRHPSGAKTVAVVPIAPNGQAAIQVPDDEGLVYVHRVYDARGRFDETAPASLNDRSRRGLIGDVEEGTDTAAVRRIPVRGGAVTVYGTGVAQGARVQTLGETIRPAEDSSFVIQRILPPGEHRVDVSITGAGRGQYFEREIDIPKSEWFYIGIADLTLGTSLQDDQGAATPGGYDDSYARGRLAFYAKGKLKNGWQVTTAADTGEDDLDNLFKNIDEKDPRRLLLRIDPDKYYPVYGDDSTYEEDAPTEGKFYLKVEKDANHILWGNFKSEIRNTTYLRNERTLYGAQLVFKSQEQTSRGDPRFEVEAYAAQPDHLPQRDVFQGTGGSTYFLKFQDVSIGSETITVEVRDPTTGRVLERRSLVYGVDYDLNYAQGLVILNAPLSGSGGTGDLIVGDPNGDNEVRLVVQYEHTPTAANIDTFAVGGRIQGWANDNLRFGASYQSEDVSGVDQVAYGVDVLYQVSDTTYVEAEYARSKGPGFGFSFSTDGGLNIDDTAGAGGDGRAVRIKGQLDFADINPAYEGVIGGYFEDREAGFSTVDYNTANDETLYGVYATLKPSLRTRVKLYFDHYDNSAGEQDREGGIEFAYRQTDRLLWEVGVEHVDAVDPADPTKTGSRTDAAVRLTFDVNKDLTVYGYAQGTLDVSGGIGRNNRIGFGGSYQVTDKLRVSGEISDGSKGAGGRLLAQYDRDENNSYYFGYQLDPEREFGGQALRGRDRGSFVIGARRKVNSSVSLFAENTYDMFGEHKSLVSAYGVDYTPTEFVTYQFGLEVGDVRDTVNGDFDRTALSIGFRSKTGDGNTTARGRIEYRRERGGTLATPNSRDADTWLLSGAVRHKFSEQARMLAKLDAIHSDNNGTSIPNSRFVEASLGYAFRPIDNDRLNVLAKYTYLYDMTGQTINGAARSGPLQKSHIFSLDASYDLDHHWTVGGKIGFRISESAPDDATPFTDNDAFLAVANLRYHVVHNWDMLFEARALRAQDIGTTEYGALATVYRHVNNNVKIGIGYNFGRFSDDLRDQTYDDRGVFINAIAKF